MTDRPATTVPGSGAVPGPGQVTAIPAQLEPNAIGVTQDTVIGMASSAPAGTIAATLAGARSGYRLRIRANYHPDRGSR